MARQNPFRRRGVYGEDLARELAFLEQSVHDKFVNDDSVEFGPLAITDQKSSLYNAKPWEVIRYNPTTALGKVVLPRADDPRASSSFVLVKNDSDSPNPVVITSLFGTIDGQSVFVAQGARACFWFFSDGDNWHTVVANARAGGFPIYVEWFGAYGDTTTGFNGHDDTAAVQAAINYAKTIGGVMVAFTPGKKYRIDGVLDCSDCDGLILGTQQQTTGYIGGAWLYLNGAPASTSLVTFGSTNESGIDGLTIIVTNRAFQYTRGAIASSRASDVNQTGYFRLKNSIFSGPIDIFTIIGVSVANPAEITTSTNHGLSSGTYVYLYNIVFGNAGFTALHKVNLPITVTAANKFTVAVDATTSGGWVSGGNVGHSSVPRMVHLGITNNAHIHHCNFQNAQIHIYGQGEGIANTVTIDGICQFIDHSNCAIANPGQAWTIAGNTFENSTAINCFDGVPRYGLDMFGNWFGDGAEYTQWVQLFGAQGVNIHGNFFANSTVKAPIKLDSCNGVDIGGNLIATTHIVEFTGGTSQFIHLGPHGGYGGLDTDQIVGSSYSHLVREGTSLSVDSQMAAPGGFIGGAFLTGSNAPIPASNNMALSGPLGARPNFDAAPGAEITWQSAAFQTGAFGNFIALWPPQNDHQSGVAIYGYDPAVATFKQRMAHWFGPKYRVQYGSANYGENAMLAKSQLLYNDIANGATTALLDAQGAAAYALQNGFLYDIVAEFLCTDTSATPGKRYRATITAIVGCVTGTATILAQATSGALDPDVAGWTVSMTAATNVISFKATNGTGVAGRVMCEVKSREFKTS